MSELKNLLKKHRDEIDNLRNTCKHQKKFIKIIKDDSCVGGGSLYPSIIVVCTNCGSKKVMFIEKDELKIKPLKTLNRQKGIKDQRLNLHINHEWELE